MTGIYLDTALLVASLVHESGTATAHQYLEQEAEEAWLISTWVETELASALAMQCRRGAIQPDERDQAWLRFLRLREQRLGVLQIESIDFETAARLCLAEAPPLRAGDAVHLAICKRLSCKLASFDQALCAAATHHRVSAELLRA